MKQIAEGQEKCKIMRCTCDHTYQDERYGPKQRLHNLKSKDLPQESWRCTVCGTIR